MTTQPTRPRMKALASFADDSVTFPGQVIANRAEHPALRSYDRGVRDALRWALTGATSVDIAAMLQTLDESRA
jgi:hypothetical protein